MKKISLFVCALSLCSLSLMAVKLDVEIGEEDKDGVTKTFYKETLVVKKDNCKEINYEKSNGIGVDVSAWLFSEKKIRVNMSSYKREGGEKKTLDGLLNSIETEINVDSEGPFLGGEQEQVGFSYGQKGKMLTVSVSTSN